MSTQWLYGCNAITTSLAVGNALAGAIGDDAGDNQTFQSTRGALRKKSDGSLAWIATIPLKQTGADAIAEFNSAGPWPSLNARGITNAQIAAGKSAITAEVGDRATVAAHRDAFIAACGYEVVP